ncbi:NAD(P)H-dependent flavin oxidoreductase [Dokdonella koreensis]|uniref:Nitronate monooxygenase n=1 Tax=Dokdonella koreensis DS-123 TaxID=1300342 RepID=A0A160DZC2_9GAMM|nr:nitronate monooxygenase family protein [Dokdonella koreensis]ANB19533.1 2-nitropropane dioxygenase NPD [Dokdonella koreensis DS-123]
MRALKLFGIALPILQAPMAGAGLSALAVAVAEAGGLGAIPCAAIALDQARAEVAAFRARTRRPLNLNFFCHALPPVDAARLRAWRDRLAPYYAERGVVPPEALGDAGRQPFDAAACAFVEEACPEVVSFHFGLPPADLLARVRAAGAKVIASATTVREARWLAERGVDAVIAQGAEAGGHRGLFLTDDVTTQVGTFALLPQVVDAVDVPVIAAGGIADGRGVAAAFVLGASAVQVGTAYLFCPEASVTPAHRAALRAGGDADTALTNLFSGRPARGIVNRLMREQGPLDPGVPPFPLAGAALAPLRATDAAGDFTSLWSGQARALAVELPAGELTRRLAADGRSALARAAAPGIEVRPTDSTWTVNIEFLSI